MNWEKVGIITGALLALTGLMTATINLTRRAWVWATNQARISKISKKLDETSEKLSNFAVKYEFDENIRLERSKERHDWEKKMEDKIDKILFKLIDK